MNRRIATCLTILLLLYVYWLRESPLFLTAIVSAAMAANLWEKSFWQRRSVRWFVVVGGVCAAWVAARIAPGAAARSLVIGEAIMLVLAAELLRRRTKDGPPSAIPLLAAAALAGAMEQRIAFERLGLFSLIGVLVVVSLGWMAAQVRFNSGFTTKRISVTLAILGIAGFSAFKVTEAWGEELSRLENQIDTLLANFIDDEIPSLYPRGGTLNSITAEQITDPEAMAVRVYADRAPGYLIGRVFDSYNGRLWRLMSPSHRQTQGLDRFRQLRPTRDPRVQVPAGQALFRISDESQRSLVTYETQNAPGRGEMVFTPRGTQLVRGYGKTVRVDDFGVIHFGIYSESTYFTYADPLAESAIQPYQRSLLTTVPNQVQVELGPVAQGIASNARNFGDQIDGVIKFLADGFEYTIRAPRAPFRKDPLVHFALTTKIGHCEMFASTAVMLLRLQGIPARYVTGYVCDQRDPDDPDYWIARNANCHAWAEAYDESRKRWVLVETTPNMEAASLSAEEALAESDSGTDNSDDEATGTVNTSLQVWLSGVQWVGIVLAAGLLVWAWYLYSDRGAGRELASALILRVDRRLAKHALTREPGETLHEFADRVAAASKSPDDLFVQSARFYQQYANLLYGGERDQMANLDLPTAKA